MKDQVLVDIYDGAVRIEVVDKKGGSAMFTSGSKEMTDEGKRALKVIAETIKDVQGKIAIEGHTDASTYAGQPVQQLGAFNGARLRSQKGTGKQRHVAG